MGKAGVEPQYQMCRFCEVDLDEPRSAHMIACPFYISVNGDQAPWGKKSFDLQDAIKLFDTGFVDGKNAANQNPKSDNETYLYGWKKARGISLID